MLYLFIGSLGFVFFIVYEFNNISLHNRVLKSFFAVGCFLIIFSTIQISILESPSFYLPIYQKVIVILGLFISFVLLIYTLFFAIPLKETYINLMTCDKVADYGIYALCRHPGVLWFITFYIFYWLFTGINLILWAGTLFSVLNLIYIVIQERYIFNHLFKDYSLYQNCTPFLIPNPSSIKKCIRTIKAGKEIRNEV